jgi:CO dehydrogenase/acetyl-CoA synthase gamma subunit (corrinoid Fe-S protein)
MDSDPTPERIMEYEMKLSGCGHIMDFVAINNAYKDVVEYKKRVKSAGPS